MINASDAELQVRLRRAAFNRALAEGDLAAIGPILSPDVVLVTGSDSAVIAGRKAQLAAWKREFSQAPRTVYLRTTESVTASSVELIAMEQGRWSGRDEATGAVLAEGTYAGKWRLAGGLWVLIAEIFVTLK
ncbi:YybH family protein [Novosphingobium jiangmenense]|uniref:Nuclear transport factor 2 family protein n=1 Tax=Novosphingobium jiangmenense TaxID=2791981 RepID=A0ABS0HHD0_9SPHN|nr:nuclear transport factor 2 family protein [Novosphingobium jiangmenense]MBF9151374.1 nuclear transport factor 2 family protein [Novosphingobium jiangmenense]